MRKRFSGTKIRLLLAALMLLPALVKAQKGVSKTWTLNEVLEVAEANNWQIQKSTQEVLSQKAEYRSTLASFLPRINLSETVTHTNDPLAAFGIKLQQEIVNQSDFNPEWLNDPEEITDFNLGVLVEQPLINPDAFAGRKAVSHKLEASKHKAAHLKYYIRYAVKQSYYAIQLAQSKQQVLEEALKHAKENHRIARDNQDQGYVNKADVMAANVRVLDLQTKIEEAHNDVVSAGQMLAFLLGMDIDEEIVPEEELSKVFLTTDASEFDLQNRSDVMAMSSGVNARNKMVTMQKMKFVPRLNAFGGYNFHGDELTGFDADSWVVGARLQWTLFSGNKNLASVKKAKANAQLAEIRKSEYVDKGRMELDNARRKLNVAENSLSASQLAEQHMEEALRIRMDRYKEGLERTSDLLAAEAAYSQKQLERLNALYNYNKAVFYLEYLMEAE
ncbi:TolC family protein [Marinilabilia salmonicolor]|uniref:TolC family protein n=1 Tax=Marinilabilia salmonicolor TaxID=989 RepID=UPI000317DA46|nr:TolC family protein [Marinilabilia salmonicolor]